MAKESSPVMFHSWQTIMLIVAAVLVLVIPDDKHKYWADGGSTAHHIEINAILIILTSLVTISLTFEYLHHHLHHTTTDIFMPVLHALNGELMGLGFLAIIFYLIEVRFTTLTTWGVNTICVECDPCMGFKVQDEGGYLAAHTYHEERRLLEQAHRRRLAGAYIPGVGCDVNLCWASYNETHRRNSTYEKGTLRYTGDWHKWVKNETKLATYLTVTNGTYPVHKTQYALDDSEKPTACDQYHIVKEGRRFLMDYERANPGFLEQNGGLPHPWLASDVLRDQYHELILKLPLEAKHQAIHGVENYDEHRRLGGGQTGECYHCDEILLHLFEDVHMSLFLVMVVYFIRSVLLIQQTEWQSNKWRKYEVYLKTTDQGENKTIKSYYDTATSGGMWAKMEAREKLEYVLFRKRFIKTAVMGGSCTENNFNFAEYLSIRLGHEAAHMVHIPPKAWAILELVFILFWACMQAPTETRIRGYMLIALCLLGIMFIFFGKVYSIRDQLLLKIPASPYQCPEDFMSQLDKTAAAPAYLQNKMKTSTNGHHITNQQEACFWWGSKGPAFIMHVVRLINMNMLIYFVLLGFALPYTWKNDKNFFIPMVVLIPIMVIANYFGPAELMRVYAIVCSVELLMDPHAIENTVRVVKLARSIRTIKLLRSLQSVVKQKKMVDSMKDKKSDDTSATPQEEATIDYDAMDDDERAKCDQLNEVFGLFDSSKDGNVDISELGGLMSALGVELTEDDQKLLMKEFDRSGDGNISFAEFYSYMRSRNEEVDTHQLVHDVFEMIDKDGSGTITVEEFQSVLTALPTQISEADIDVIVREIDVDGGGDISLHEFAEVLEKYK
jgi:Ca2+-binding EF-hand superfamily protein